MTAADRGTGRRSGGRGRRSGAGAGSRAGADGGAGRTAGAGEGAGAGTKGAPLPAIAAVVAITALGFAAASPDLARALLVGLPAVLVPGWAVATALAPRGWPDGLSRAAAVLGFGLVSTIACGLVLGATPIGLSAPTWLAALALLTAASVAVARRRGARPAGPMSLVRRRLHVPTLPLVAGALLVLVAGVSVGIARAAAEAQLQAGFTQLWIGPAADGRIELNVASSEPGLAIYRLELWTETAPILTWGGIRLDPGATWTERIAVPVGVAGPVIARLYLEPGPDVYRSVTWWPGP